MQFFRRALIGLVLTTITSGVSACSDGGDKPKASPTPSGSPADELAAIALAGLGQTYSASYALQSTNNSTATLKVRRAATAYRIDIVTKGSNAILIRNKYGTFSCEDTPRKRPTCFYVARAGSPIPPAFDAGVQKVFGTYLEVLSKSAQLYTVSRVAAVPATGALPEGRCFDVAPTSASPKPAVVAGTYCFTANGIPVHASFASGRFDMSSIAVEPPAPNLLAPPTHPTPIPNVK